MRLMEGVEVTETPRIKTALAELQQMIVERYPTAAFRVSIGEEPIGFYLEVTVDLDDPSEVRQVYSDRLVDIQVDEELPIYVSVRPTEERREAQLREQLAAQAAAANSPAPSI